MFGVIFWRFLLPILVFESAWKKRFVLAAEDKVNDHGCNKFGVCLPGGEDIAVSPRTVTASSTCGSPTAGQYCQLIPFPPSPQIHCSACDSNSTRNRHPADFMIDRSEGYSGSNFSTFWQSQTWWEWFQTEKNAPLMANITLAFNKSYIVTGDIRVTFASPKPSQMVIEKSVDFGRTWLPLQYFADNCREKFNMTATSLNCSTDAVLCTEKYSDLNAGVVYFSFLNCYTKETFWDKTTQDLTIATDIRLRLEFPATDGRHIVPDEFHMNRYFYAISDIQVFGRCQCNGHAPNCEFPTLNGKAGVYVNIPTCICKHHTEGTDCERCEPLYNNKTWMPATSSTQGNLCEKCECYEHASSCVFNSSLEHGVCDDCRDNTTGYFCEQCKDKFYRNLTRSLNDSDVCLDCDCALEGVTNNGSCSQEVSTIGQCMCRNNVTGRRCDRCNDTYYGYILTPVGSCVACQCRMFGMINDSLNCNQTSGQCTCKTNIELRTCSQCKLGFYNFPNSTETDCLECNCDYGGSTEEICERAKGRCLCRNGIQGTTCSNVTENRFFARFDYFLFEAEYQPGNYTFTTDVSKYDKYFTGRGYAKITAEQLYIDFDISVAIDGNYSLVLRYSEALGNIGIRLRGDSAVTGCPALDRNISVSGLQPRGQGVSWRSDETFTLCSDGNYTIRVYPDDSAAKNVSIKIDSLVLIPQLNGLRAYIRNTGPDIDACLANFSTIQGGNAVSSGCRGVTFSTMVELFNGSLACECSKIGAESETCDAYGGQCRCKRGVMGRTCDRCQPNYYNFTENGCSPCDCDVFGSHNLSVCDPTSGQCICKHAVEGRTCGQCEINFFGLNTGKGCEPCNCNTTGSLNKTCDGVTGKCYCKPGVEDETTDKCERCQPNYFNFTETGCQACNCDKAGSRSLQCHQSYGQCPCKINASGKKCGNCVNATYALEESNPSGCTPCFCFNRTQQCSSAEGFVLTSIVQSLNLTITPAYYIRLSPQRFAGNQLYSYGRLFQVHISGAVNVSSEVHLHLNGSIQNALFRLTSTQCDSIENGRFCVLLHENNAVGVQKLTAYEMQSLLVDVKEMGLNLTRLGNQLNNATVLEVSMGSARRGAGGRNDKAQHVEKCACPENYKKLSCDECSSGFTRDIANSNAFVSCSLCSCNNRSKTCDPASRVCSNCRLSVGDSCEDCEYGVDIATGCTECLPEFWSRNIILYGCQACNCVLNNTVNHNSSVCNATSGQCSCKTYVGGQQCQRCDDNYYNTTHGCRECPTCYGLIQNHVEDLKTVIERVQQMVDRLIIRFKSIGHKEFAQRLSNVRANVSKMFERATDANSTANDGTENLNDTQNGLGNLSSSIDNLLTKMDQLKRLRNELEKIMNRTINWTETAYRLLNDANLSGPRIETLAKTIASFLQPIEFDKTELRRLNKTQWDISQNLTSNSNVQSRKIDGVLVDAGESKSDLEKVATSVRVLQNKSNVASADAEDIKESSVRYSESAENVKDIIDEVLNTVKELGVLIEVNKNLSRAFRVENRSMGYLDLEKNVSISVNNAYTQIHRSNATLNSSYALLNDARSAHRQAIQANESAKATLDDAIRTRYILREFQNRSQHAERVANDALQQISTTNEVSRKSIENIRNVSESITDALSSTDDALKLAKKAYSLSSAENQNITSIYNTSKFLQGKQNPATCSRDMMSDYKRNVTDRNQTLAPVVTSCPSREANTAAIVAAAAVSRSEKTMNNATGNHGNVFDFSHVVSKAKDAVEAIEAVVNSQVQQNKIDTHGDAFTRLREETKKLREAKEEKAMFIQQLRAKVNTMKSQLKDLESLRDSLRDLPPCGGA